MIPTHGVTGIRGFVFVGSKDGAEDRANKLNTDYLTDEFEVVEL